MASSLEELLTKEGFKGSKKMINSRPSFHSDAGTGPLHPFRDQPRRLSVSNEKVKTERTISDVSQYQRRNELFNSDTAKSRIPSNKFSKREQRDEGLKNADEEKPSSNGEVSKGFVVSSSEHIMRHEITEVREQEDGKVKRIYSNEVSNSNRRKEKSLNEFRVKEKCREMPAKDRKLDKRHGSSSSLQLLGHFSGNTRKNAKQQEKSYNRSDSKSFEDISDQNHDHATQSNSNLALDEVAVKAIVSILNGHIKRFLKDEDFRTTLRHNCFSSLDFIELEEEHTTETKVITSLELAIDTVEQAAEKNVAAKDLKRASLQLSIITGLSLNDLKFGFTCGIPNYKLSACAHLYLSVLYKIQKKDKVSAKHLLQVFCDSPFQARTTLLPELWEHLFAPHLSHLKVWYKKEADILADAPNKTRKMKLLEKLYNENLDSGTNIFAAYYKDWLDEGIEAPSIPSISIPSISVAGSSLGHSSEFSSSIDPFSPQPMVSKKLYDSVFGSFSKSEVEEDEDKKEEENLEHCVRGSHGSTIVKQTITCASETVKYSDENFEEDFNKSIPIVSFHPQKKTSLTAEEELRLNAFNSPYLKKLIDDIGCSSISRTTGLNNDILDSVPHIEENKLALKKVTRSVSEMHDARSSSSPVVSTFSQSNKESVSDILANPIRISSLPEGSDFPSIPNEFICPLTGSLFEEPVTLETGQTFERAAIKTWFEKGNRTCPITGNPLDSVGIPVTNLVLKRLIDNWKSKHFSHVLNFTSQIVGRPREHNLNHGDETAVFKLEHLFSSLNAEGKNNYAKHLISLGVIEFLLRRFELGNEEERTHVVALLLNFIEVDSKCMNQIARDINKKSLVKLLHVKEITPRTNAVLLLTDLLTLKRRNAVTSFLSGLTDQDVFDTMHVLLLYLTNSPTHQKPLIAVLLLHFDLLVEPQNYSIYRETAVISIANALYASLNDERVREKCCRVLLTLSGHFSSTGKILTKTNLLKQAGYSNNGLEMKTLNHEEEDLLWDDTIPLEDEEEMSQEWLMNLFKSLVGDGERPFLKAVSRCLNSSHQDLVTACLATITWLSSSFSILSNAELHLPAFLAVISQMKQILENGQALELRTLASLSLLNFSKNSECKTLLRTMADDIAAPLRRLADVTWTAKQLLAIVCGEDL